MFRELAQHHVSLLRYGALGGKVPVYCVQLPRGLTHFPGAWYLPWERVVYGAACWKSSPAVPRTVGHTHHAGPMMTLMRFMSRWGFCRNCLRTCLALTELPGRRRDRTAAADLLYLRTRALLLLLHLQILQYLGTIFVHFDICLDKGNCAQFWDSGGLF